MACCHIACTSANSSTTHSILSLHSQPFAVCFCNSIILLWSVEVVVKVCLTISRSRALERRSDWSDIVRSMHSDRVLCHPSIVDFSFNTAWNYSKPASCLCKDVGYFHILVPEPQPQPQQASWPHAIIAEHIKGTAYRLDEPSPIDFLHSLRLGGDHVIALLVVFKHNLPAVLSL